MEGKIKPDQGRVAIDAIKWTASKLKPKVYGDKQFVETKTDDLRDKDVAELQRILEAERPDTARYGSLGYDTAH